MNYITEIRLFNEWLETHDISPPAFALWHGLMYIAWRGGWQPEFTVPVSVIMFRTGLCRSAVYKERILLRDEGLIEFKENAGRLSAAYRIIGFEEKLASIIRTQQDGETSTIRTQTENPPETSAVVSTIQTQPETQGGKASIIRTQPETQNENPPEASTVVSTIRTQPETQNGKASTIRTQSWTQNENPPEASTVVSTIRTQPETQTKPPDGEIKDRALFDSDLPNEDDGCRDLSQPETDPYISIYINKDRDKGGYGGKKKNGDGDNGNVDDAGSKSPSPKKRNAGFDLSFIGDEVWEGLVESWLDYKRSRSENYKSELSVKKFHTMLRNYSRGDPGLARQIIDKSIANNWAGIFELSPDDGKARNQSAVAARPATGQRIGQIKQPEDEERRRRLLEKFGRSGDTEKK
jgi:hypothetical protein